MSVRASRRPPSDPAPRPGVALGTVFAFPMRGGWGACQVVAAVGKDVEVVVLDHRSETRPELAEVRCSPLVRSHHYWRPETMRMHVGTQVPQGFEALGVAPPVLDETPTSNAYGSWESFPLQAAYETHWRTLPEDARRRFYEGLEDKGAQVIDLPSGRIELPTSTSTLRVAIGRVPPDKTWIQVDRPEALDWRVFDALPCITTVEVCGEHPGLLEWVATRPLVQDLQLGTVRASSLDLRGVGLYRCSVAPAGTLALKLPSLLERFTVDLRGGGGVEVEAEGSGRYVALHLDTWDGDGMDAVEGLGAVSDLSVSGFARLDLPAVAARWNPRSLRLDGAPGRVYGSAHLASMSAVEEMWWLGCLSVDAAQMPPLASLPRLKKTRFFGLMDSEVEALRAKWGRDRRAIFREVRDERWALANADHPLLRWPTGRWRQVACHGFSQAAKRLAVPATSAAEVSKALATYVHWIRRGAKEAGPLGASEVADVDAAWETLLTRAETLIGPTARALVSPSWG